MNERLILGNTLWKLRQTIAPTKSNEFIDLIHFNRYPFPFERLEKKEERLKKEIYYLSKSDITFWHISPNKLREYAYFVSKYGINFDNLKFIENNSAFISQKEKQNFENLFNCKILDNYGCREIWTIAYYCKHGYLHCNNRDVYFELIDDNGKVIEDYNTVGHVVVTSKIIKSMPFIRYKLGDRAVYRNIKCICGNNAKIIEIIPDRVTIDGTNINGSEIFLKISRRLFAMHGSDFFNKISVQQIGLNSFIVFTNGNTKDNKLFKKTFTNSANELIGSTYSYIFDFVTINNTKDIFEKYKGE